MVIADGIESMHLYSSHDTRRSHPHQARDRIEANHCESARRGKSDVTGVKMGRQSPGPRLPRQLCGPVKSRHILACVSLFCRPRFVRGHSVRDEWLSLSPPVEASTSLALAISQCHSATPPRK